MTMQPAAAAFGANSRETAAPAENSPMSAWLKSNVASSSTGMLRPLKVAVLPSERLLARGNSSVTGNSRSSRTLIIVSPTSPVAPTTATLKPSPSCIGLYDICVLRPVAQVMIQDHDCEHRFDYWRGAQRDARIMAAGGDDFHRVTRNVDRAAGNLNARRRLERNMREDILAGGYPAQYTARVVAQETLLCELIAMLAAA